MFIDPTVLIKLAVVIDFTVVIDLTDAIDYQATEYMEDSDHQAMH